MTDPQTQQLIKEIVNVKKLTKLHHDILTNLSDKETPFHTEIADKVKGMVIDKLPDVIAPLIPEPIKGDKGEDGIGIDGIDGNDYILTAKDKKEIADSIKVPVVKQIIEKTEVIRETPIVTNEIREVAVAETAEVIVEKINELPTDEDIYKIDFAHLKNVPDLTSKTINGGGWRNLYQMHDVSLSTPTNGQVLKYNSTTNLWENGTDSASASWGTITGTLSNQTDLQTALNTKADKTFAIAMAVALG